VGCIFTYALNRTTSTAKIARSVKAASDLFLKADHAVLRAS
jgi:hypothetical protein